jgi:glucuronosyltransferase
VFMGQVREIGFDLTLVDTFLIMPCNVILPNVLGIPYVSMGHVIPWTIRLPVLPSYYSLPSPYPVTTRPSTFLDSVRNTVTFFFVNFLLSSHNNTLIDRFAPDVSSYDELIRKSELFLTDNDPHFDSLLPAFPNVISVPGYTVKPPSPLSETLSKIFDDSGDAGVILASFGSVAHYMPADVVKKFFDAFARLNVTVVAKFGMPDDVSVPPNVHVMSWLPQNDILGHPKTRLFITHCGDNGQHEALYHGVPMLGFPMFAEQAYNCHRAVLKGYALEMNIHSFSAAQLEHNIREIVENATYRTTIQKASAAWRDQPLLGREKAAFWIEHVIKHGGAHLRFVAMEMPLYRLLMLDVLSAGLLVVVFVVLSTACLVRFAIRRCFKKPHIE